MSKNLRISIKNILSQEYPKNNEDEIEYVASLIHVAFLSYVKGMELEDVLTMIKNFRDDRQHAFGFSSGNY